MIILVDGCLAAGHLTCQNGGICNKTYGTCDCSHGYNGTTCSECMFIFNLKKSKQERNLFFL